MRHLTAVDVKTLRTRVERLPDRLWQIENRDRENDYFCFHHTQHIVFRFISGNRDPHRYYSQPIWRIWQPWLLPVMESAAAPYGYVRPVYPKVMLARLKAGHGIDPHIDGNGGSHPLVHKVHVPIETNPQAVMRVQGEIFHLAVGHAFEVNNLTLHGAVNGGEQDRIHLIFEVFESAGTARDE